MRNQQLVWQKEHKKPSVLRSLAGIEPSSAVKYFVEFLKSKGIRKGKALDIGCGKGRNAVFLAKQGFEILAVDYIQTALDAAKQASSQNKLDSKIQFINSAIDESWPFEDDFFDLAIDCFSSIDIEILQGRIIYRNELKRTLKPGSMALVAVVSSTDEMERRQAQGPEKNSVIWPNGKFQKNYDEKELREFYKDFEILEIKKVKKSAFKLGKNYMATNFWVILQKP